MNAISLIRPVLLSAALAVPMLSQATSLWHPADNAQGYTTHASHFKSDKSRDQVRAELATARQDGTMSLIARGLPLPAVAAGPAKTRQQVIDEMRNEPAAAKRARQALDTLG